MALCPADVHTLAGNADSVEFCPTEGFQHLLAAATYTLVEGDVPQRLGQVYLFDAHASIENSPTETPRMHKVFERDTCGIFDLKWSPQSLPSPPCLGQASADGSLSFYQLSPGAGPALDLISECQVSIDAMCLSLDWQPETFTQVVTSQSDGAISTVDIGDSSPCVSQRWRAHDLEVWVASFDRWDASLVYSGADDCALKGWDVRTDCSAPVFSNRREHSMGVCTVASNPKKEHQFVSGSYDERVRVWDKRNLHRPVCMHVGDQVGGGVWRLKWHPHREGILLGACMHGGARVFNVADNGEVAVLEEYMAHGSLTYGADWCYQQLGQPPQLHTTLPAADDDDKPFKRVPASNAGEEGSSLRTGTLHSNQSTLRDTYIEGEILRDVVDGNKSYAASSGGRREPLNEHSRVVEAQVPLRADGPLSSNACRTTRDSRDLHRLPSEQLMPSCSLVTTCSFYDRSVHLWKSKGRTKVD